MILIKFFIASSITVFGFCAKAENEIIKKPTFENEFACYSKIADNSFFKPKGFEGKYYFSGVVKDASKLMCVEKRLGPGKVARLYLYTDDGAFPYVVNQTQKFNEYIFHITTHGKGRIVGFDRTITENGQFKSLSYVRQNTKGIQSAELPVVVDEETRNIFRESLAERIQYVKSTFDKRTNGIKEALKKLDPLAADYQDQISGIPPLPVAKDYMDGLLECRKSLEKGSENQSLISLVDTEIGKFQSGQGPAAIETTVPELNK